MNLLGLFLVTIKMYSQIQFFIRRKNTPQIILY